MKNGRKSNVSTEFFVADLSYAEVEGLHIRDERLKGKGEQQIKNICCSIKSWLTEVNIDKQTSIGEELGIKFAENLKLYLQKQIRSNRKPSTYLPKISRIKKFRNFYVTLEDNKYLPQKFGELLKYLIKKNGFTFRNFIGKHLRNELCNDTLRGWCNGRHLPRRCKLPVIKKIEQILNVPANTLVSTLPTEISYPPIFVEIKYRTKLKERMKKVYRFWSDKQTSEFLDLVVYKTSIIPPNGMERAEAGFWTSSTGTSNAELPPSAKRLKNQLKSFFGFLLLPPDSPDLLLRGAGIDRNLVSMTQLTDKNLTDQYFTVFLKERAGGKFNNEFVAFISGITCLLRKDTGYLYQKPELANKINLNLSVEQWQNRCLDTRKHLMRIKNYINAARRNGNSEYQVARNPQEPIKDILELKYPLSATLKMVKSMEADVGKHSNKSLKQALLFRDCLLLTMIQANPLRASMFRKMELRKNLFKETDGSWWIYFDRSDFKNRRFLKENYKVKLSSEIWRMIERYLSDFRHVLLQENSSDFVFVKASRKAALTSTETKLAESSLYGMVAKRTRQYIKGSAGFGCQSYRHVVATSIMKNDPSRGIDLAAAALHDNRETVRQAYEHLKANDRFEPYNDFFGKLWTIGEQESQGNFSDSAEDK